MTGACAVCTKDGDFEVIIRHERSQEMVGLCLKCARHPNSGLVLKYLIDRAHTRRLKAEAMRREEVQIPSDFADGAAYARKEVAARLRNYLECEAYEGWVQLMKELEAEYGRQELPNE